MSDRPTGVTIVAILNALSGVGFLLLGLLSILHGSEFSLIFLIVALYAIVVSLGMLAGLTWAWYLSIIGYIINIISGIALSFLSPITIISVLLNIAFIFYFLQEHVREFFEV